MKNTILRMFAALIVVGVLGAGVYAWKFPFKSVDPEAVLPEDTFMAFEIDFTDGGQRALVRNMLKKFPKFELSDEVEQSAFDDLTPIPKGGGKDLWKILKGEWKLVVGLQHKEVEKVATPALPADLGETGTVEILDEDSGLVVFVALKSDKIGKAVDLLDEAFASKGSDVYEKGKIDDVDFWYDKEADYKTYRYGDTIFIASDSEADAGMIARVKSGEGFNNNVKFSVKKQGATSPNLGFAYFDQEKGGEYVSEIAKEWGFYQAENLVSDSFVVAVAENYGIRMSGDFGLSGDGNYNLSLIEKVPGGGMIWYSEQPDFSKVITGFFAGFPATYSPVEGLDDPAAQLPRVFKTYDDVLGDLAETFDGVSTGELDKIFKSPFAVSFSYPGGFLPALGLYLQLDDENVKVADKLVTALGNYANEVVADFDEFAVEQGAPEVQGAFTQEVVSVQGGAARKVYLDWKKMPQDLLAPLGMLKGLNLDEVKLEFYYGVTGDNVLFVVFHPDFDKVYGTETLYQNPLFQMAQKDVLADGFMINFLTLSPLADMVEKYFAVAEPLMALVQGGGEDAKEKAEDLKKNVKKVEDFLRTVKYFIDTDVYKDGIYKYDGFVRFE